MTAIETIQQPTPPLKAGAFLAWTVDARHPVTAWQMDGLFNGQFAGLHMPGMLAHPAHLAAVWNAHELGANHRSTAYGGNASNLKASGGPTHFEPAYAGGNTPAAWAQYFEEAQAWDREQQKVFASCPANPEDLLKAPFVFRYGAQNVTRLTHPRYGRQMSPFLVRKGYALNHIDFGQWDLGVECVGHVGAVVVLDSSAGTVQRVYRYQPSSPVYTGATQGNYGLEVPVGTEFVDVPSVAGDYNLVSARYVHALMSPDKTCERLTCAAHFILTADGHVYYYA